MLLVLLTEEIQTRSFDRTRRLIETLEYGHVNHDIKMQFILIEIGFVSVENIIWTTDIVLYYCYRLEKNYEIKFWIFLLEILPQRIF